MPNRNRMGEGALACILTVRDAGVLPLSAMW